MKNILAAAAFFLAAGSFAAGSILQTPANDPISLPSEPVIMAAAGSKPVPEPATLLILGAGAAIFAGSRKRAK